MYFVFCTRYHPSQIECLVFVEVAIDGFFFLVQKFGL